VKKLNLSIYPTPLEIKNLFYLDSAGELRWKTDHLRNKAGDYVTFYLEKDRSLRLRYWSKKSRKFHLISGAIIVWVLIKGELPSERGIFALNGDNTDLSFANWAEQDVSPVKIDASNIKEFVYYDGQTGTFKWQFRRPRNSNDRSFLNKNAGKPVCVRYHDGYQTFKICNKDRKAHRWAWLYVFGELPAEGLVIDHIDRNPANNSINNLRVVTQAENARNTSKYKPKIKKGKTPIKQPYPDGAEVRAAFYYDAVRGELHWRKREEVTKSDKKHNTQYAGERAGRYIKGQPVLVRFKSRRYTAQELIWSYEGRPKPDHGLICKNGDKHDLRIDNWLAACSSEDYFQSEKDPIKKQAVLKELIHYDPHTGIFTLRQRNIKRKGDAGLNTRLTKAEPSGFRRNRYHYCTVLGKDYHSSHLAWLYCYGVWPPATGLEIDHINLNSLDNRIANLRLVSHAQNMANQPLMKSNNSGFAGVIKDSQHEGKWRAYLSGKTLGIFHTKKQAIKARQQAERDKYKLSG